ncbi:hypothetical protein [Sulfurimonas sp.]|uniref:hypothetical protein n=1 Tax=Sulfurimonas sp. TaxID=2022749 RepID=UPI0035682EE8
MQNDIIDMIEPTPKLHSKKCKLISYVIWLFLKFTTYIVTILSWYLYDYFIAFLTLILSFIVMGIIRSKLRNIAIPQKQQEYQYNDKGIADWYTARELCYDEANKKIERI